MTTTQTPSELSKLRIKIADIDQKIISLVAQRVRLGHEVGKIKRKYKAPIEDLEQEKRVLVNNIDLASKFNLELKLVKKITEELILWSKKKQTDKN